MGAGGGGHWNWVTGILCDQGPIISSHLNSATMTNKIPSNSASGHSVDYQDCYMALEGSRKEVGTG